MLTSFALALVEMSFNYSLFEGVGGGGRDGDKIVLCHFVSDSFPPFNLI